MGYHQQTNANLGAAPAPLFPPDAEAMETPLQSVDAAPGLGSGFGFFALGDPLLTEDGLLSPQMAFSDLARHLFYTETGKPLPDNTEPAPPLLGIAGETAVYLLWNGRESLLLDGDALHGLSDHGSPKIVYAASCLLSDTRLETKRVRFWHFPYAVKLT